jgi:CRISPR/Cas system-associated protein endoribonuclease Cas2
MDLKKTYNNLPMPVQYLLLGGISFLAFQVYKKITSNQTTNNEAQAELQKEIQKELLRLKNVKLSYALPQYKLFANLLHDSMKYGLGDNYQAVVSTLQKMNNDKDVLQLVKDYGNRQNYIFGIPQGEPKDLFTTIKSELGNEYAGLTSYKVDKINDDWKKKKINYKI